MKILSYDVYIPLFLIKIFFNELCMYFKNTVFYTKHIISVKKNKIKIVHALRIYLSEQ